MLEQTSTLVVPLKTIHIGDRLKIDFRNLTLLSAGICFGLSIILLVAPQLLLSFWSVGFSEPVGLVCRRTAALFAGIAVMLFRLRHCLPSPARSAVAIGLILACSMLALLGIIEFTMGHSGPGILLAGVVEIVLALGFYFAR